MKKHPRKRGSSINIILKEQLKKITPEKPTINSLKVFAKEFINHLKNNLGTNKADIFLGGSFAKNTLIKEEKYDVDIFVRFDWKYSEISNILEKALVKTCKEEKLRFEKVHGSRDYFKVFNENNKSYLEIIPVTKIKNPREARNVTDLSYFHVSYIKKNAKNLEDQIRLAKSFFKAQEVYGAETYIGGFSGYAIELLITNYKSFLKTLRELSKIKKGEKLIIDIEKKYKKKNEVFIELNESKIKNPIILIDPTYKERNALASLQEETFHKFQESAKKFLKNPSEEFFIKKEPNIKQLKSHAKKTHSEFIKIKLDTFFQKGDIAGTKLKKFSNFLHKELEKYFLIKKQEFDYNEKQTALIYIVLKPKKQIIRIGPPIHLKKAVREFKKRHMQTYEKNKIIHAKLKLDFTGFSYLDVWIKSNQKTISDMGIEEIRIIER